MEENRYVEIVNKCGTEYIYRQLAEECSELTQACLKLIRAKHKETPMRMDEAHERLLEEFADVLLMMDIVESTLLSGKDDGTVLAIMERKEKRMYERLLDGKMEEDVW